MMEQKLCDEADMVNRNDRGRRKQSFIHLHHAQGHPSTCKALLDLTRSPRKQLTTVQTPDKASNCPGLSSFTQTKLKSPNITDLKME